MKPPDMAASVAIIALGVVSLLMILTPKDDSDPPGRGERSGMGVHTDALTGCQYLSRRDGIIARRNGRGEHLGCRP